VRAKKKALRERAFSLEVEKKGTPMTSVSRKHGDEDRKVQEHANDNSLPDGKVEAPPLVHEPRILDRVARELERAGLVGEARARSSFT
jgi:hypothetical protein